MGGKYHKFECLKCSGVNRRNGYYKLEVPAGTYTSDNILFLIFEVFKHRFWHLFKHRRWMD